MQRVGESLERQKLIRVESRGFGKTNRYVLLFDPLAHDSQDTSVRRSGHQRPPRDDTHALHKRTPVSAHYRQLLYPELLDAGLLQAAEPRHHKFSHTPKDNSQRATLVGSHRSLWERAGHAPEMFAGLCRSLAAKLRCSEEEAGALLADRSRSKNSG